MSASATSRRNGAGEAPNTSLRGNPRRRIGVKPGMFEVPDAERATGLFSSGQDCGATSGRDRLK